MWRGKADIAGRASDTGRRFSTQQPVSQARVSSSGYQRASRVPMKPQTQADKLLEKLSEKCLSSVSSRALNKRSRGEVERGEKHFSLESNPQLKNRNATHSSGCNENESLDEFGGEMGLCESQGGKIVVSLLLSLSLLRLVGAENAGGKSLCARKTELLTATAPYSPLQTPR